MPEISLKSLNAAALPPTTTPPSPPLHPSLCGASWGTPAAGPWERCGDEAAERSQPSYNDQGTMFVCFVCWCMPRRPHRINKRTIYKHTLDRPTEVRVESWGVLSDHTCMMAGRLRGTRPGTPSYTQVPARDMEPSEQNMNKQPLYRNSRNTSQKVRALVPDWAVWAQHRPVPVRNLFFPN